MSMRILDLQRRLREIGRIRIGEQVPTKNGRSRPAKLDVFRLTSRDRAVIEAAADKYGGTAEPWDDSPDGQQWQVRTTTAELPAVVPPGDMSFSQAYEQWTAGGCKVRCDGQWDHVGDKACHCDPENRSCAIHSRLSLILPELPGLGVWRLDTSGYYAAVELGGIVDLAAGYSERGQMIPARLRLEQRSVKRDGKTNRFAVPVLDLSINPMALTAGASALAIESGDAPSFTPVPADLDTPPVASVSDQVKAVGSGEKPKRRNAQAKIPSTGTKPRTASAAASATEVAPPSIPPVAAPERADQDALDALQASITALSQEERDDLASWWKGAGHPPIKSGDLTVDQVAEITEQVASFAPADGPDPDARNKKMWAMVAEAWPTDSDADRDELRKHLIAAVTEARTESSKDLAPPEWDGLFQALEDITAGTHELHLDANNVWVIRKAPTTRKAN